ncbi:MAG: cation-translocating P-type ATPase [Taibaiella sp.]|nr:cation-translocating P-type ATPase [Taibaiella sp.]
MQENNLTEKGLNTKQVLEARAKYGSNQLSFKKENGLLAAVKSLAKEPMILLLLVTSSIYFIVGNTGDGIFLVSAIVVISGISLFQDSRSRNALDKLKNIIQPNAKVIRDGIIQEIKSEELVIGDSLVAEEGTAIAADAVIISSNDFSVNESILTGESFPVFKDTSKEDSTIYNGTSVASGLAVARVVAIGNDTRLGKIGKSIEQIQEEKTPLEQKINNFVKKMVIGGSAVFVIVWLINYIRSADVLDSLLKALTLAMSILPEEIPVAFTTFMALGAYRLMKTGIVVKQMKTVETLGSATVICTDKTGTITENKMTLARVFVSSSNTISDLKTAPGAEELELINIAMWASEPIPFDPMEVALHNAYTKYTDIDNRPGYKIVHEYPLEGKPPMMTHIFENEQHDRIIACKGAPEAIMNIANLTDEERQHAENAINRMASLGYRLLGVGESDYIGSDFPEKQQDFKLKFKGIVAFYDPPKKNIQNVLESFYNAGIAVKIVTGDNAITTNAIAQQIGFRGYEKSITGDELMKLNEQELADCVSKTNIFTRMFPDAKLKIINALKAQNEIVAMTGDGVNDGPALKAAHIGIAMGKKGTEIAKQAASLILQEDDLSKMVDAVAMGRKIYNNLKKAIQYIISIHIPIILTVFIPLALGWLYPNIFSPLHVIFLELIMGPTCSIIYENEPMEENTMLRRPRPYTTTFFSWKELTTSVVQGLIITCGTLSVYQYAVHQDYDLPVTRTMVFTTLIAANIFLTLINRSFHYSILTTLRYKNSLVPIIIASTVVITAMLLYIKPFATFFGFAKLSSGMLLISILFGSASVLWFEVVKWYKRRSEGHAV